MFENKCCGSADSYTSSCLIKVPDYLPEMLRALFTAATRTQPSDILEWSSIYYRMKANGEHPLAKPYYESPDLKPGPGGLTPSTLKALAMTLSNDLETYKKIEKVWHILSLDKTLLSEIINIGDFKELINPKEFIGIVAACLTTRLRDTMLLLCNTFSNDYSKGILLDHFLISYRFLARLDSNDTVLSKKKIDLAHDDKTLVESMFEEECININTKITESVICQNNEIVDEPFNGPPMNTICEKRVHYTDDHVSLLSCPSIVSDTNSYDFLPESSDDNLKFKQKTFEKVGNEDIVSLDFTDSGYSKKDTTGQDYEFDVYCNNNENFNEDLSFEVTNAAYSEVKHEDNKNEEEIEVNEENNNEMEPNKDFIVMLALVSNENSPLSSKKSDKSSSENESTDSQFSLIEKIELLDNKSDSNAVEKTGLDVGNDQTFEENNYLDTLKESSDSESSSDLNENECLEIDQQSNPSVMSEKSYVQVEGSISKLITKDSSVLEGDKINVSSEKSLVSIEFSMSTRYEFMEITEEAEKNYNTYDEMEKYSNISKMSASESEISLSEKYDFKELRKRIGIGPILSEKKIQNVIIWVTECAKTQNNYVHEHNLLHFRCPPLDHISKKFNRELNII